MPAETDEAQEPSPLRHDLAHDSHSGIRRPFLPVGTPAALASAHEGVFVPTAAPLQTGYVPVKRVFDLVVVLLLAVPALAILGIAGLCVWLTSRGPILYVQVRLGRGGRRFTIWKLRSMVHNCEHETGPRWASALEAHITPIGRLLRRTHVDELPQLWNVLCGDMSLVGPRPERPEFAPLLAEAIPGYGERLAVQPGMTGLAQVQLPPDTTIASVRRKLKYDLWYVRACSLGLDFRILASTVYYLVGVHCERVPGWLRAPGAEVVETAEGPAPHGLLPSRIHDMDTQVQSQTRAVPIDRRTAP